MGIQMLARLKCESGLELFHGCFRTRDLPVDLEYEPEEGRWYLDNAGLPKEWHAARGDDENQLHCKPCVKEIERLEMAERKAEEENDDD